MTLYKYYMCGYNGFQQITQCSDNVSGTENKMVETCSDSTQCDTDLPPSQSVCVPTLVQSQPILWTWSQVWTLISPASYHCYGYNSSSINTTLNTVCGFFPKPVLQVQGHNVLVQSGSQTMLLGENGTVTMVTTEVDDVTLSDATKDKIYGTKDNHVFEGEITQSSTDPGMIGLSYTSLILTVQIDAVSCGFEHTVIMSNCGQVFSLGLGSRGQLGHGEVTVDYEKQPREIKTFDGIHVVAIATGGWHSCAITDTGDLYVWGWNESGQLGLPNGSVVHSELDNTKHTIVTHNQPKCKNSSCNCSQSQSQSVLHYINHVDDCLQVRDIPDTGSGTCSIPTSSDPCKYTEFRCMCDKFQGEQNTKNPCKCYLKTEGTEGQKMCNCNFKLEDSDCVTDFRTETGKTVMRKLYQSVDCVQIQTVPYGLDIPEDLIVKKVACGSRHTCVLFDCGSVYTTGWNKYGQLCQGDLDTRDILEIVPHFTERQVVDVKANLWNTLIVTDNS